MYEENLYARVTDDPAAFTDIGSDATYEYIQKVLFYSNAISHEGNQGGIFHAIDHVVGNLMRTGKELPLAELSVMHRKLAISDHRWGATDTIEPYNHVILGELLQHPEATRKAFAEIREHTKGPAELDEKEDDSPAAAVKKPDDPTKEATPATELDKKAKDDDNNTSVFLLAGGLAVLFMAFGQR